MPLDDWTVLSIDAGRVNPEDDWVILPKDSGSPASTSGSEVYTSFPAKKARKPRVSFCQDLTVRFVVPEFPFKERPPPKTGSPGLNFDMRIRGMVPVMDYDGELCGFRVSGDPSSTVVNPVHYGF